ncbi:MAG: hypothetical protein FWC89_05565, partial [Defluviitaleaceae bacterium]|nr:hypothetical protein [Defluviitaleaceae bacterium]
YGKSSPIFITLLHSGYETYTLPTNTLYRRKAAMPPARSFTTYTICGVGYSGENDNTLGDNGNVMVLPLLVQ